MDNQETIQAFINNMLDKNLDEALGKGYKIITMSWFKSDVDDQVWHELIKLAEKAPSEIDVSNYVWPKYQKHVTSLKAAYTPGDTILGAPYGTSLVTITLNVTSVTQEALLAKQLSDAKRAREQLKTKATEELHGLIFHLLGDKLVQALSWGDSTVFINRYPIEKLSSGAVKQALKLSDAGEITANSSPYIPNVIQPYVESFKITYNSSVDEDPYLTLWFTLKD